MQDLSVNKPDYPDWRSKGEVFTYLRYYWRDLALFALFYASMWIMQLVNRPFGTVRSLEIPFDSKIPLLPWTVVIYNSWVIIIFFVGLFYLLRDRTLFRRYMLTMILGQLMADITFPFFQTRVPVPYETVFAGEDIWSKLLAITYRVDNPYCGFPSIHVIVCTLSAFFIWKSKEAPAWMKVLVTLYFTAVALTTVTTKQHVVLDIPGGLLYAFVAIPLGLPLLRFVERKIFPRPFR